MRDDERNVIVGKPVKKLKVGFEGVSAGQYKKDMKDAIDFTD